MPASKLTIQFHQELMTQRPIPSYSVIPDAGRWLGDVSHAITSLTTKRTSFVRKQPQPAPGAGPIEVGRSAGGVTHRDLVTRSLERYHQGILSAGEATTSVSQSIHGSLLTDISVVTGRFMAEIESKRNEDLRTDTDCAVFPLYRALNSAAADAFGLVYDIGDDQIEICLQRQLKGMAEHGANLDADVRSWQTRIDGVSPLVYLKDAETLALKLQIIEGKFYVFVNGRQREFDCSKGEYKRKKGNTAHSPDYKNNDKGVAGFAMGHDRSIYASAHKLGRGPQGCFYHSAYMEGQKVLCAGAMTVQQGQLTYINNASGHYQPSEDNLSVALNALQAQGVNMERVIVQTYVHLEELGPPVAAPEFLKSRQGAGFTEHGLLPERAAKKIRDALVAYETRKDKWWSCPSPESRRALASLKSITDDRKLLDEVNFLLSVNDKSPLKTPIADRLKADGELAKRLKIAMKDRLG